MISNTLGSSIVVNSKTQPKCQFCKAIGHTVNSANCPRAILKTQTNETILTTNNGTSGLTLRSHILSSMNIAGKLDPSTQYYSVLDNTLLSSNFIIHGAYTLTDIIKNQRPLSLENDMAFHVSFLGSDGQISSNIGVASDIVINGKVMNELIIHTKKKKKFIFDETILRKPGSWNKYIMNIESSDSEDDVPISSLNCRKQRSTASEASEAWKTLKKSSRPKKSNTE